MDASVRYSHDHDAGTSFLSTTLDIEPATKAEGGTISCFAFPLRDFADFSGLGGSGTSLGSRAKRGLFFCSGIGRPVPKSIGRFAPEQDCDERYRTKSLAAVADASVMTST
jgi:hypothetical protein